MLWPKELVVYPGSMAPDRFSANSRGYEPLKGDNSCKSVSLVAHFSFRSSRAA